MNTVAVILAGGKGTRISEETKNVPKPMIMLGDKPILRHIMDEYMSWGVNEFIIPTGFKQEIIFGYFLAYATDVVKGMNCTTFKSADWTVTLVPSGLETQTGGRLAYLRGMLWDDFYFTYGDGLSTIDITKVMDVHKRNHAIATISGVRPVPRFGSITVDHDKVIEFGEKQEHLSGWINGGFAVMSPKILDYIFTNDCNLESDIYPGLSKDGLMYAVCHDGFWHCVDTLRDLDYLNNIYSNEGSIWLKH